MNRINTMLIMLFMSVLTIANAKSFEQAFVALAPHYTLLLDTKARAAIIEAIKDTSKTEIKNIFAKTIEIQQLDSANSIMKLKVSENACYEFRKITYEQKTLYCFIRSIISQPSASQVFFFDDQMQNLALKIKMPEANDWISDNTELNNIELMHHLSQSAFISISFDSNNSVRFDNHLLHVLTLEQKKQLEPIFKASITRNLVLSL